jgi:hypothetical protein
MLAIDGGQDQVLTVVLAALNVLQTVLLAWVASRSTRRRIGDLSLSGQEPGQRRQSEINGTWHAGAQVPE